MITLALLHPSKSEPLKSWTFEDKSLIRIGRATDNDVVILSSVVSRHHLQVFKTGDLWELENLGANGTFFQGKAVKKTVISDGMILSLAGSGPKLQIYLRSYVPLNEVAEELGDEDEHLKQTVT